MASMPNVMSQELFLQIGEAQGFGEVPMLFAKAWAEKTGSGLQGKEALYALKKAMKRGEVKTADVLPSVTKQLSALAEPTLAMSARSSQSEQNRWKNAIDAQVSAANAAGVESGYARIWRSLAVAMKESTPIVESLSKAFDEISKYVSFGLLLPQSIKRAFEGRDSWVTDTIGQSNVDMLKSFYDGMKELGSEIKTTLGIAVEGWGLIFSEFGDEMLAFVNGLKNILLYTFKALNAALTGDLMGANNSLGAVRATLAGKSQDEINLIAAGEAPMPTLGETASGAGEYLKYTAPGAVYGVLSGLRDKSTEFYSGLWDRAKETEFSQTFQNSAAAYEQRKMPDYRNTSGYTNVLPGINTTIESGAIIIQTAATNAEGIAAELEPHIKKLFEQSHQEKIGAALLMVGPQKE